MTPLSLRTERLLLRPWRTEDIEPFARLCGDSKVMRWIGDGSVRTPAESQKIVDQFVSAWARDVFGIFAIERKDSAEFIGFCGLSVPDFLPEVLPAVEIGWRLARSSWGMGFATQARASVRFAFDEAGLRRLLSIHQVGNDASARIMEKLGMKILRETVDPSCGRQVRVFELKRESRED